MDLYDVLSEGCHTPLTSKQIANLFHAGSFSRDEPCRRVDARSWRTLDEFFPLLKYDAGASSFTPEEGESLRRPLISPLASALIVLLLGSIAFFTWDQTKPLGSDGSFVTHRHRQTAVTTSAALRLARQQRLFPAEAVPGSGDRPHPIRSGTICRGTTPARTDCARPGRAR